MGLAVVQKIKLSRIRPFRETDAGKKTGEVGSIFSFFSGRTVLAAFLNSFQVRKQYK